MNRDFERTHGGSEIVPGSVGAGETWPAGRAVCATAGHFVTCVSLRVALPLVASKMLVPTNGRTAAKPVYSTKCPPPA
jgi:hypothetical protein